MDLCDKLLKKPKQLLSTNVITQEQLDNSIFHFGRHLLKFTTNLHTFQHIVNKW